MSAKRRTPAKVRSWDLAAVCNNWLSIREGLRFRNGAQLKKHQHRFWPIAQMTALCLNFNEAELLVEPQRVGFRINHDPDTAHCLGHSVRDHKDRAHQFAADALTVHFLRDSQTCEAKHR